MMVDREFMARALVKKIPRALLKKIRSGAVIPSAIATGQRETVMVDEREFVPQAKALAAEYKESLHHMPEELKEICETAYLTGAIMAYRIVNGLESSVESARKGPS
jgi:hypothetical protein